MKNNIHKYRRAAGLTQKELSRVSGACIPTHLSDIEKGKKIPSVYTALKISKALGATVEDLFNE